MKKELIEFQDIEKDLYEISESPCFNDDMRNYASALYQYISEHKEEPFSVGEYVKVDCEITGVFRVKCVNDVTVNVEGVKSAIIKSSIKKLTDGQKEILGYI